MEKYTRSVTKRKRTGNNNEKDGSSGTQKSVYPRSGRYDDELIVEVVAGFRGSDNSEHYIYI